MTTGKELYKWLKEQDGVRWPKRGGGFIVYLIYNDVNCRGMITKTHKGGVLIQTDIAIRPIQSEHDIGAGAGQAIYKTFCKEVTKPKKNE